MKTINSEIAEKLREMRLPVFASEFERNFSSLRCRELRPGGFSPDDPPHLCECLSVKAIQFSYEFLKDRMGRIP